MYPTKHQIEQMSDGEIYHLIRCCRSSHESRHPNSKDSMTIALANQVLAARRSKMLGANGCEGYGSKTRVKVR